MSEDLTFFSESDMTTGKDGKKKVASEYPAWYNRHLVDELSEDINVTEIALREGRVQDSQLHTTKEKLSRLKSKLEDIESSVPKFDAKGIDRLAKVRKELGKDIASMMYSRSDMQKGLADSHDEARRMTAQSISLSPEAHEIAKACNVTPKDGRVSRTEAEKIWKIAGRFLGEGSNTESLRRD